MHGHDGSTVVTMYRPDRLQVRVDVRFEDIPKVSLAQPVRIENAALASPLTGQVLFISSEADIQKNTLQVKVAIPSPPSVFKPEMLVDVTFLTPKPSVGSHEEQASRDERRERIKIFVPQHLVWQDRGASFVWVADRSAKVARKQEVQIGQAVGNGLVQVTRGLNVSTRIIATGADGLTEGCRIHVSGEDPAIGEAAPARPDNSASTGSSGHAEAGGNPPEK